MPKTEKIKIKRAYDEPAETDGYRILVDRIWPRGISKAESKIDEWLKDIAPSKKLRTWFAHDPDKWEEFKKLYFEELNTNTDLVEKLIAEIKRHPVTLLYAAKDENCNNAVALKEYLEKQRK